MEDEEKLASSDMDCMEDWSEENWSPRVLIKKTHFRLSGSMGPMFMI